MVVHLFTLNLKTVKPRLQAILEASENQTPGKALKILGMTDKNGATASHWATRKYNTKNQKKFVPVLEWFTQEGFDFSTSNEKGETVLTALSKKANSDSILALIDRLTSEQITQTDSMGNSPLSIMQKREDSDTFLPIIEKVVMEDSLPKALKSVKKSRI